jgi:hypothetical protein
VAGQRKRAKKLEGQSCEGRTRNDQATAEAGSGPGTVRSGVRRAGGYAFIKVQDGQRALTAFSAAQSVELSYNDQGQLVDRGETAGAAAIMDLLVKDWGYTVDKSEFNPADPMVNTASEYMFQMATISYHVLHGAYDITLDEDYTAADGTFYAAGTPIPFNVEGRYYSQFDRATRFRPQRGLAWKPTAGLVGGGCGCCDSLLAPDGAGRGGRWVA